MTVSTTNTTITQQGNGATTVWTFPFIGVAAGDLIVSVTDSGGSTTVLLNTQYSVLINVAIPPALWGIGGSITYPLMGPPLGAGSYITVTRAVPFTQTVSIANQSNFYPQSVEQGLDLLELQIQQLSTDYLYTMKFPLVDGVLPDTLPPAAARANMALTFDSTGQPVVTPISGGGGGGGGITFAVPRKITTTGTATIGLMTTDSFGGVSIYQSSTPSTTVQLPGTQGPYPVFDASGNAATYPIIILPPAGKLINGQTQYILAFNYQSASFFNDGTGILVL